MSVVREVRANLAQSRGSADSSGMIGDDDHILSEHPQCLEILQAYAAAEAQRQREAVESAWLKRTTFASDPDAETPDPRSNAHGLLIAYGFLDIELLDRASGMGYRLTTAGKQAVARAAGTASVAESVEDQDEADDAATDSGEELDDQMAA